MIRVEAVCAQANRQRVGDYMDDLTTRLKRFYADRFIKPEDIINIGYYGGDVTFEGYCGGLWAIVTYKDGE